MFQSVGIMPSQHKPKHNWVHQWINICSSFKVIKLNVWKHIFTYGTNLHLDTSFARLTIFTATSFYMCGLSNRSPYISKSIGNMNMGLSHIRCILERIMQWSSNLYMNLTILQKQGKFSSLKKQWTNFPHGDF